jgi:hypothetical protein
MKKKSINEQLDEFNRKVKRIDKIIKALTICAAIYFFIILIAVYG